MTFRDQGAFINDWISLDCRLTRTLSMNSRSRFVALIALIALAVLARRGTAQAAADASSPIGVWRGTSLCLVRPSSCNDEVVVYRITRAKGSDSLSMDARKIVNAKEEEMGVLACRIAPPGTAFNCSIPSGVWRFTVRRDSLVGELRRSDSTKFRDVRAARSR
ncbi:MAG TPA: hypothetical protein VNC18_12155 [Gemmatimonadaceae bacterium]|jgi:hypothetical protein|nr:hypothetical protein [Gemmatimonadaceae bacterium]